MGNYRFRLSDMMPNAWFYKLKDMSSRGRRNHSSLKKHHPNVAAPSSSYSPRTSSSSTHKSRRKTIYRPSSPTPVWTLPTHIPTHSPYVDNDIGASPEPDYLYRRLQHHHRPSHSSSESDSDGDALASFDCKLNPSTADIIIDINQDQSTSTAPRQQLLEVAASEVLGEAALGDLGEELAALGEFHDDVDLGTGGEDLEEEDDVWVAEAAELEEESFFLWMTLSATLCPVWRLRAWYTLAKAPQPRSLPTSYLPKRASSRR